MSAKVYIILLNYNGWKDSIECLESLFKLEYQDFEIILVDNKSTNESVSNILKWANGNLEIEADNPSLKSYSSPAIVKPLIINHIREKETNGDQTTKSHFTLIETEKNGGFSYGNNVGLKYAIEKKDGDYFWILNNDTVVNPNSLSLLVSSYETKKKDNIGILGAKVKYYFKPEMIQCIGGGTYNKWLAYSRQIGNQEIDRGQYDKQELKLDLIIGACMFVDKSFIDKVGFLAEEYFLYYEEQDWAERAKRKGLNLACETNVVIYHKEGQSIGGTQLDLKGISKLSDYYYARNKILLSRKFFSVICQISVYLSFLLIAFNRIRRGQANRIPMLISILINPKKRFEA